MNDSGKKSRRFRRWGMVGGIVLGFLSLGIIGMAMIARECGQKEFCRALEDVLGEKLEAEVTILPMRSHSLVFLECPTLEIRDRAGKWALRAERVNVELSPEAILSGGLGFRSILIPEMEVWLGCEPDDGSKGMGAGLETRLTEAEVGLAAEEEGLEAHVSREKRRLPWWLQGRIQELRHIPIESIRVADLTVVGPPDANQAASFALQAQAEGRIGQGELRWAIQEGTLRVSSKKPWTVEELSGEIARNRIRVGKGVFVGHDGAVVTCRSSEGLHPVKLTLEVEAEQLRFQPEGEEVEKTIGPMAEARGTVKGIFSAPFPNLHRFRFLGDVELEGLKLGESRVFRLLAGQTGEEQLRATQGKVLSGRLECTPGVVRLTRLNFYEEQLVKLEGWLSVIGEDMVGVFDLSLPAQLVGRIPGGKPKGFSFPAGGWSRARLRVEGGANDWNEDLSQRLIAQISHEIPVKAGPKLELVDLEEPAATQSLEERRAALVEAAEARKEKFERLFYTLIGQ